MLMPIKPIINTAIAAAVIFQFLINTLRMHRSIIKSEIIIITMPARDCDEKSISTSEAARKA